MSFRQFNLHMQIEKGIEALGYTAPTPIQLQSMPVILQGKDVMGLAQTGTGKTAAFALPILQRLMSGPRRTLRALIIAPTRELAEQIHEVIGGLGRATKLKSVTVYGGVNKNPQIRALCQGVEIAVACPGRLLDLADQGEIDLSHIEVLVLDEADRMFDMGFLPDIRKIMKRLPTKRQTLLFSATMPDDIRKLAKDILHDPVTIRIGTGAPVSTVSHALYPVEPHLKTALLMKLIERTDTESVLVFARTKHRTTRVAEQMKRAGFPVASLQGNLTQNRRQDALSGFREGKYQILVATDIAARGIDVSGISHVINYDMPDTVDAYTHRIGRTGRAAKTGDAFTFVTSQDRAFVGDIEHVLGERIERRTLTDFDYNVPAPAGSSDAADRPRHSVGRRPARVSEYAPVKKRGDSVHGASRPSGRRSGTRSLEGFSAFRSSSKTR
ncbi:MAG: RNA helicase [Deltaproteobacteria bacterium RBG_16_58_17]|nr:MAG: RNA helicase [Deltaproteobacteria bacterium RBG_16_58_17]OHE17457.1 MAG: RNA helicase [Syntrophobacterales bacterium GWC2_56_13]